MSFTTDFNTRFPELAATSSGYLPAIEPVLPCYYGGDYDVACDKEALLLLAAHLMTVASTTGTIQQVTSQSVGSVSQSFAAKTTTGQRADFFNSTKYGMLFLMLTSHTHGAYFV